MQDTKVMLLGRLAPQVRMHPFTSRRVTPQQPQNLFRAATLNGLAATSYLLRGLGATDPGSSSEIIDPWAANVEQDGALQNSQSVAGQQSNVVIPGQATSIGNGPTYAQGQQDAYAEMTGAVIDKTRRALKWWIPLSLISATAMAYHGYKRDHTAIAAFGWGVLGSMFPVVTPVVAVVQGFGKPRRG